MPHTPTTERQRMFELPEGEGYGVRGFVRELRSIMAGGDGYSGNRLNEVRLLVQDSGRLGQAFHYATLAAKGGPKRTEADIAWDEQRGFALPTRRQYVRAMLATLRYGPSY